MFASVSDWLVGNSPQLRYGVAITDVDGDGVCEAFVAGFGCPNEVWKWDGSRLVNVADPVLADPDRQAIGVAAGDLNGDGREAIYVLNTDTFGGRKRFADRLFAWQGSRWQDLFALPQNQDALNLTAGRSVLALDRLGRGRYGFVVANYGGPMRLYELDPQGMIADVAPQVGLALTTGGRGLLAAPLLSERLDIVAVNENGPNFLFRSRGDGTYEEVAALWGFRDPLEHGRGVALVSRGEGWDVVYGNWEGPHRLLHKTREGFRDQAPPEMAYPSRIRTVIAADFDNDGYEEIFFNNIGEPNRLFGWRDGCWQSLDPLAALEPTALGTGAAVADFDQDGVLELLISHGESGRQPLSLYKPLAPQPHWIRVQPLTPAGSPARGAVVVLATAQGRQQRVIDGGSGYLCQMEPIAHFGLGSQTQVDWIFIRWPDGVTQKIPHPAIGTTHRVPHP
ncbi:MAG: CRTAC1 family protein [Thermostichales cyanobacterium DRC_bins_46]